MKMLYKLQDVKEPKVITYTISIKTAPTVDIWKLSLKWRHHYLGPQNDNPEQDLVLTGGKTRCKLLFPKEDSNHLPQLEFSGTNMHSL